ncbi:MAG: hypothetical protein PVSMB4_09300 [Ktedonobacterales bacterium]
MPAGRVSVGHDLLLTHGEVERRAVNSQKLGGSYNAQPIVVIIKIAYDVLTSFEDTVDITRLAR